jgi:hypothetical protein
MDPNRVDIYETIRKIWIKLGPHEADRCSMISMFHVMQLALFIFCLFLPTFALGHAHGDCIFGRMLLKSRAHSLAPERYVLDAARRSIQLRGYYTIS